MSAIDLQALMPPQIHAVVKGALLTSYEADDLALLDQDILEVTLPNDMRIDVGWFPENDPNGRFVIRVFRKNSVVPVIPPTEDRSPSAVAAIVANLASRYGKPFVRAMPGS